MSSGSVTVVVIMPEATVGGCGWLLVEAPTVSAVFDAALAR